MLNYSFDNKSDNTFFSALRKRVNEHFADSNIRPTGGGRLLLKASLLIVSAVVMYVALLFFTPPVAISLLLCGMLGLNLALIGFNVMHDGGHQSFSRHGWINITAAHMLNTLGGSAHYWQVKHNINHHTYTNIEGMDSDINVKPFMRLHEGQPLLWYHRFQHIYWVVLYGISYLVWVFYEDFQKYFSGRISPIDAQKKLTKGQHVVFWATKILYILFYVLIPIYFVGFISWLIGFLLITFVCGVSISIVFQLAHVVEATQFFSVDSGDKKNNWAIHQVRSTADFATRSRILHWMLGGLNFQIEHHLFPRISHIHYPAISKYVKQTCHEYDIVYHEYKSMFAAIISHITHLYHLGRPVR